MKADLNRVERGPDGKSKVVKYKDYGTWIKSQDKDFQEEILGIERAKLLREDKIQFKKMYTRIGKRKTVKELKKHYL